MAILRYLENPLDDLLRRAAARGGDGPAVTAGRATLSYPGMDREADRIAHCVRRTARRPGAVVAAAPTPDTVFPCVYYGVLRSGHPLALVDPQTGPAALHEVLTTTGAEIAFVPAALAEVLIKLEDRLPLLHTVVVTDAADGVAPGSAVPLATALADVPPTPYEPAGTDVDAVACTQFTPHGAGGLRPVRFTHRNLIANAAQTTIAHHLAPGGVIVNHLPLHHPAHLNAAVHAGSRQVLCTDPDPWAGLALAARTGAEHYYGLSSRLERLARDERFAPGHPDLAGLRLRAVLAGGTALEAAAARRLRDVLGVPVLQGYGLRELCTLSHHQLPGARPGLGAVGMPLPGTECRVVAPAGRTPVPVWATGAVEVRGPQLAPGSLGAAAPDAEDGWLRTGDAGYLDEDGGLHVVDHLGDVFACDEALVAPSLVERVIGQDPRVAECIVADWPDPVHGALVWAGIVLRDAAPSAGLLDVLDSIAERANSRLGPGEQIRRLEALDTVPRGPGGTPARRRVRTRLHAQAAVEAAA
ncbi:class I adenylate-forming enzyme family protein [Streptomyces sp. NPDC006326]|uniref:class I adenylate-forming enzyme family protein n=1 Tax=Streptomyces sp. NPDC006326 TaxID=3156752 RepID=UPI0033BF5C98